MMIGQRFQMLTVIGEAKPHIAPNGKLKRKVLCRCDCGGEISVQISNLKSGNSKSCGCQKLRAMQDHRDWLATPQVWELNGDSAWTVINNRVCLVSAEDLPLVSKYRWLMDNSGYLDHKGVGAMHRLILGLPKGDKREVDHMHHVPWDNRRSEIRIATSSQNKMNRRKERESDNTLKGCTFDKARGKWMAQIRTGQVHKHLGRFETEIEAAIAYDAAAREMFGEFAHLNFPNEAQ